MRFLVTGASGFLGEALCTRLTDLDHEVWSLTHDQPPWHVSPRRQVMGSLESLEDCERAVLKSNADIVFHLGAQAMVGTARRAPHATFEANVRGTYNILTAFDRHGMIGGEGCVVIASSDKAYGELPDGEYLESDPLRGRGFYDASKACADLIAQSYAHERHLPVGIVRAGNIYGPGDGDMSRIVPSIASSLARGNCPILTSDGTPIRDYVYINDVVTGYELVSMFVMGSHADGAQAFNLSGGEPIDALSLAGLAIKASGLSDIAGPSVLGIRGGEIKRQVLNTSKAQNVLGWSPRTNLEDGLRRTIEWWRAKHRLESSDSF